MDQMYWPAINSFDTVKHDNQMKTIKSQFLFLLLLRESIALYIFVSIFSEHDFWRFQSRGSIFRLYSSTAYPTKLRRLGM
jgi:hypothetical protein